MNMQAAGIAPVISTAIAPSTRPRTDTLVQAWRLFVAIPLPAAVLDQVAIAQRALAAVDRDVRWVRPEHAHLTLHFLGDTPQGDVANLTKRLTDALATAHVLPLHTTGVGAFPNLRRPRVLWLGLDAADDPAARGGLAHLASAVRAACTSPAAQSVSTFVPHITLGRLQPRHHRAADTLSAALAANPLSPVAWQVERVALIRSVLGASGPTYTTLHTWPLPTPDITDHG